MEQEPRKATDVLLSLETKVNALLDIVRAQDLVIKVLSNKLNEVMDGLKKQQAGPPKIVVEAVQTAPSTPAPVMPPGFKQLPAGEPERTVPISAESTLPQADAPRGFRRTSRPETFAGDEAYLNRPGVEPRMPVQLPQQSMQRPMQQSQGRQETMTPPPGRSQTQAEVMLPPVTSRGSKVASHQQPHPTGNTEPQPMPVSAQGQVPIMRRVVDKNGKSIFLADVEITDLSTSQPVFKTRTNGTGKWMASLGIGAYQVKIGKRAAMGKEKLEATQDIQVDGTQSPLELPMLIIK